MNDIIKINTLFNNLLRMIPVQIVAYHKIIDGALSPVYIIKNPVLTSEKWKTTHARLHVTVKEDPVLKRVVKGQVVVINDVLNDKNSSPEFKEFGIQSITVIPLFTMNNVVNGIIVLASCTQKISFDKNDIEKCRLLIKEFNKDLIVGL